MIPTDMLIEAVAVSLSCLLMTLYLTAYITTVEVPASISATYYRNENKWLFPTTISATGLLALVPIMNHTPETYQFVAFFIIAATLFVAAAPAFREDFVGKVHAVAASILGLCALAWLILSGGVSWIAILGLCVALIDRRHFLFWIETGLLYNLFTSLLFAVIEN